MEQQIFDKLLSRLTRGAVSIRYPNGTKKSYGYGPAYFELNITTTAALRKLLLNQSLGLGEGYMDGSIEITGPIDQIIKLVNENEVTFSRFSLQALTTHRQSNVRKRQQQHVQHHYDLGNDFYKLWLDKSLTYSCAYFRSPKDSLEKAQDQKLEHVLRKLQLSQGQKLLDIGSGWGSLLLTAAQKYGISGLGITLSRQQYEHSMARAKELGLEKRVKFELLNYQDLAERKLQFDRIASVGMFEHVGQRNHASYYQALDKLLAPGGISVLHTISSQIEAKMDAWVDKYIFPGSYIPSAREVVATLPQYGFWLLDYENLRTHYAMTLDEWLRRFEKHQLQITKMYDERFVRMWRFYLATSSGSFRYGPLNLSQFVFSKGRNNDLSLTREHIYRA